MNAWTRASFKNLNGQWDIGTSRGFNGDQFFVSRLGSPGIAFGIQPNSDAFLAGNVTVGGNVGIGTATPAAKLEVAGNVVASGNVGIGTVNANGTVARQFSAPGGTITATAEFTPFSGTSYQIDFPFQINGRFISLTPFNNGSVGIVAANFRTDGCTGCGPNRVFVYLQSVSNPGHSRQRILHIRLLKTAPISTRKN